MSNQKQNKVLSQDQELVKRVEDLLGFPVSGNRPSSSLVSEVLETFRKEEEEKVREQVVARLRKLHENGKRLSDLRKKFEGEAGKIQKELDKELRQIEAMARGLEAPQEDEEAAKSEPAE